MTSCPVRRRHPGRLGLADAAVHPERLAPDKLAGLVRALAGPAPCSLIVEGVVIALADDADGMAVVKADQIVRI